MAKPTLADRITAAIKANDAVTGLVPMGQGPIEPQPRTYLSPTDSYEDEIGPVSQLVSQNPGSTRGMWSVADQQQASVPVTALTSSGNSASNTQSAIIGGISQNPTAPATTWAAMPQMIVNLKATGPVMVTANATVRSSVANDTAGFALYRDGLLLGNHVTQNLGSTSAVATVNLSTIDNPPIGNHVYALYWSPGTGTLVAVSNSRNFYAINLTPQ